MAARPQSRNVQAHARVRPPQLAASFISSRAALEVSEPSLTASSAASQNLPGPLGETHPSVPPATNFRYWSGPIDKHNPLTAHNIPNNRPRNRSPSRDVQTNGSAYIRQSAWARSSLVRDAPVANNALSAGRFRRQPRIGARLRHFKKPRGTRPAPLARSTGR